MVLGPLANTAKEVIESARMSCKWDVAEDFEPLKHVEPFSEEWMELPQHHQRNVNLFNRQVEEERASALRAELAKAEQRIRALELWNRGGQMASAARQAHQVWHLPLARPQSPTSSARFLMEQDLVRGQAKISLVASFPGSQPSEVLWERQASPADQIRSICFVAVEPMNST